MKKTILLVAALLTLVSTTFAGGDFDFGIGPKVGYQTARLSYKKADIKAGFSNHFTAGIFARFSFGRFYVQPETLYFKTSNDFSVNVTGLGSYNLYLIPSGATVNLTLNQLNLQVPLLIGYNLIDSKVFTLRVQAGPTANFVMKSSTSYNQTYTLNGHEFQMYNLQQEAMDELQFETKTVSWGLQAGIGVDLLRRVTLDINYNFGLSKLFDDLSDTTMGQYFDFSNADNTKQGTFMVTLGIKFF